MAASGWHRRDPQSPAALARKAKYKTPEHRAARAHLTLLVKAGRASCWRCGNTLLPGQWHVGHDDVHTELIRGGECSNCNLKAAAQKGARIANARRKARRAATGFTRPVR